VEDCAGFAIAAGEVSPGFFFKTIGGFTDCMVFLDGTKEKKEEIIDKLYEGANGEYIEWCTITGDTSFGRIIDVKETFSPPSVYRNKIFQEPPTSELPMQNFEYVGDGYPLSSSASFYDIWLGPLYDYCYVSHLTIVEDCAKFAVKAGEISPGFFFETFSGVDKECTVILDGTQEKKQEIIAKLGEEPDIWNYMECSSYRGDTSFGRIIDVEEVFSQPSVYRNKIYEDTSCSIYENEVQCTPGETTPGFGSYCNVNLVTSQCEAEYCSRNDHCDSNKCVNNKCS
jgi:hypothetical protein